MKKLTSFKNAANMMLENGAPINPTDPQPIPMEMQNLSLDMKVDSYFMKYEKESLPTQQNYQVPGTDLGFPNPSQTPVGATMQEDFKTLFMRLLEADEPPTDAMGDAGGDMGAASGDMGDSDAPATPTPTGPAVENPRLNVRNFAQSIARLVLNFEGLVDPRTVILNRAKAYIEKNYDAGVSKQMMELLSSEFQLAPRAEGDTTPIQAPLAAGAWTGVGGG